VGKVFKPTAQGSGEQLMAAGVLAATGARHWQGPLPTPDVFSAKAAVLQILGSLGAPVASGVWEAKAPAHYHPGRSGTFSIGPFVLAHMGELHPSQRTAFDIPAAAGPLAVFEIYLEPLLKLTSKARPWVAQTFPPVKRDLSVLVPNTMPAAQVLGAVQQATRKLPQALSVQAEVFDAYSGKGVPEGHVALGIALTMQNSEKTLADADVQSVLVPIVESLTALGGMLRDS
jgi:phenylalanyl-tRNA synthetase beta chain